MLDAGAFTMTNWAVLLERPSLARWSDRASGTRAESSSVAERVRVVFAEHLVRTALDDSASDDKRKRALRTLGDLRAVEFASDLGRLAGHPRLAPEAKRVRAFLRDHDREGDLPADVAIELALDGMRSASTDREKGG
jgi:hypothetical protein